MSLPQIYSSPFHATLLEAEANQACAEADYLIHSRDIPTRHDNSHRKSWELRELSTLNTEASHPLTQNSSDSYEPNRLGSQS
jgi:hypothetical protein